MDRKAWIIASVLSVLVVVAFVGLSAWQRGVEVEKVRRELESAREATLASAEKAAAQTAELKDQVAKAQELIDELKQEKERLEAEKAKATAGQKSLEQEMRAALESKDITISQLQGKLTVNILDRILFDSGEAVLRTEGEKVLQQIAGILAQYPKRQIHVIGHTDNVPIRAGSKGRYASNWELSTARATAAVRFLAERAAVDPQRLGALGYGEFHPIADNATPEGRAKNRRIALVVLAEDIAPTDVPLPAPPVPLPARPEKENP